MASSFLDKMRLDPGQLLAPGGVRAVDSYAALRALLAARTGEAADLFAEPVAGRREGEEGEEGATVSWYAEGDGDPRRLSELDGPARTEAEGRLARGLAEVRPLLDDPDAGPLVAAALHLRGADDVWTLGGRPVLAGWGVLPPGLSAGDAAGRAAHYAATLGRFLPLAGGPALSAAERAARAGGPPVLARGPSSLPPGPPPAPPFVPVPEAVGRPSSPRSWPLLLALLALAALLLGWLLWPGTRVFPAASAGAAPPEGALALAVEANRGLEERARELEAALDGMVCRADGTLVLPDGRTPEGLLPPTEAAARPGEASGEAPDAGSEPARGEAVVAPAGVSPPAPEAVRVPDAGAADAEATTTLFELIDARTVLVVAMGRPGTSDGTGSGFFVGPDLVVTNHHVVADALDGGEVLVTSRALGELRPATVLKVDGPLEATGADFALLRVAGAAEQPYRLWGGGGTLQLQNVIAAGYPGDMLDTDAAFGALAAGDATAVPALTVTEGIVSSEQEAGPGSRVLAHSASTSRGNSGGPLVDLCGRVVGVNTFVRTSEVRNLNFALSSGDLLRFLAGTPAAPDMEEEAGRPQVVAAPPAEAPAEAAAGEAPEPEPAPTPEPEPAPDAPAPGP